MKYKSLFRVAYLFFVLAQIPASINGSTRFVTTLLYSLHATLNLSSVIIAIGGFLVSIGILYLLIQFMEPIFKFFRVDKTFGNEAFHLNGKLENIPLLFAILYGLYLVISPLPYVLSYGYDLILASNDSLNHVANDTSRYIVSEILYLLLGFALLAFSKPFSKWAIRQMNMSEAEYEE